LFDVKNKASLLFDELENLIVKYRFLIEEDIKKSFKDIITSDELFENKLFENIQILIERFEKILEINNKYKSISTYFDPEHNLIEKWKIDLNKYYNTLADEMYKLGQLSNQKMLNIKLLIAKNLSLLDVFLGGEKYKNLYNKNRKQIII